MKTKLDKKKDLAVLEEKIPQSSITVFTTFAREGEKGLTVSQMQELKRAMRAADAEYLVTKKTLVDKAMKDLKYDGVDVFGMGGSVGVVIGKGDSYAIAKKLYDFAKKNQVLQYFGALFENKFVDKSFFMQMATMPSREALLGRLLGMMKYPLTSMAIVLGQIAKQKEQPTAPAEVKPAEAEVSTS